MSKIVSIKGRPVGEDQPVYIIAEIGINHNGDIGIARRLIDIAQSIGCDAVKFQKRTPELCVPPAQRKVMRDTPWGIMTYLDYRRRIEFGQNEYTEIDRYCSEKDITWFASCWDENAVDFLEQFDPACYKIASACLSDEKLLEYINSKGRPMVLSTGMSRMEDIEHAVELLDRDRLLIAHCTSTYPAKHEELNLRVIQTLRSRFNCPIGYSGHEVGLQTTCAAVVMGAVFVERHITLDRAMWGSDHAASVEPQGFQKIVRDIRVIEKAQGNGVKQVYESEKSAAKRLRG
ncbi:N-acetylneuraminate synthase family protein [Candidatus Latescibacterota bacterium]